MFFYLKCKEDKICGFSSSVFLKEKASYPSPVQDLQKRERCFHLPKPLNVSLSLKTVVSLLLKLTTLVTYRPHPFRSHTRLGLGLALRKAREYFFFFFFCHCIFMAEHQESI